MLMICFWWVRIVIGHFLLFCLEQYHRHILRCIRSYLLHQNVKPANFNFQFPFGVGMNSTESKNSFRILRLTYFLEFFLKYLMFETKTCFIRFINCFTYLLIQIIRNMTYFNYLHQFFVCLFKNFIQPGVGIIIKTVAQLETIFIYLL